MSGPRIQPQDLMNAMGMGYAYVVGKIVDMLLEASRSDKKDELFWLDQATKKLSILESFSDAPGFPMPMPVLTTMATHVFPSEMYRNAVVTLWAGGSMLTAIENLILAAREKPEAK